MIESNRKLVSISDMFNLEDNNSGENGITMIPIDRLVHKHNHSFRTTLGEKKDNLLIQSIKEFGILQPLVVRSAGDGYEIIAGHRRTILAKQAGLTEVPVIIKDGLTEEEYDIIESETNLTGRDWSDMLHSERARVIAAHYNATLKKGVRKGFLEEINEEIKTLSNPVTTRAEEGLSPLATNSNLRDAANDMELSKDTIARYLRVNNLVDELKDILDDEVIALRAAVELSYITPEHQTYIANLLEDHKNKLDIKKAEMIRVLESKGELDEPAIDDIVSGNKTIKKAGRPKAFKMQSNIIYKYFTPDQKQKEIEDIIDNALELYFNN